jgi:hypothetical protein
METPKTQKNAEKYCEICDFKCCKNSEWIRHINTKKHMYGNHGNTKENAEIIKNTAHECVCGKTYSSLSGIWKHKKICNLLLDDTNNNSKLDIINKNKCINNTKEIIDRDLIMLLIKENSEFKNIMVGQQNMIIGQQNMTIEQQNMMKEQQNIIKEQQNMMMKVIENGTNNTNITHTNSHNKAFNLNFFLNETCKDAMNITDFVDSIKLQLSDLEKVGEVGYVEGISNIIIKNLNDLDETKRPLHCTDKKRETIYIKDQGQWEKEDDNKTKLKKSINKIANKNIKLITQFREKYPECRKSESKISDKYNKMIIEAMGGLGDNNVEKEEKIIRNITKATTINK